MRKLTLSFALISFILLAACDQPETVAPKTEDSFSESQSSTLNLE